MRVGTATALEVVLRRRRVGEDPAHGRELLGRRAVRGAGDRELLVVEVRSRPHDGKRLERLRRGAEERDEPRIARGEPIRPSRTATACTTCRASTTSPRVTSTTIGPRSRRVRARVRLKSDTTKWTHARATRGRGVGARARPARLPRAGRVGAAGAHRDAEDVRAASERARGPVVLGLEPPRQEPALPDRGRRARPPRAPDERGAAALPRARDEDAEEADVPAHVRRRRRARAHRGRQEEARRRLAPHARARSRPSSPTSAPTRSTLDAAALGGDPRARAAPAPSAPPRPAGARGDRPRARERDPLGGAAVAVQALDRALGRTRSRRSRRRSTTTSRARSSSGEAGKGDAAVYRVHGHFGEPCPRVRRHAASRRLRGAHDHVLRRLPDRRQGCSRTGASRGCCADAARVVRSHRWIGAQLATLAT